MRQLLLITTLLCCMGIPASASYVTGYAYDAATALPIPGQKIYVRDSFSTYKDSALTASDGSYTITLPGVLAFNRLFVYTYSCGRTFDLAFSYNGTPCVATFSVCAATPLFYMLHGNVTLNGTPNSGPVKLYLIRKYYDPAIGGTALAAIDSITTTTGSYSKSYATYPAGAGDTLLLKAALQSGHSSYAAYVPTYFDSALVWSSATAIGPANFISSATDLKFSAGTNPGGAGFIGGSVLLGANKSTGVGDPLPRRLLILTSSAGKPLAYTYSDAAGKFSFSNLATGSYRIFGDAWGKANPALIVTLSSASPRVTNVTFEENSTAFRGHFGGLSVAAAPALVHVMAYPNPVTDDLRFAGLDAVKGAKTIVVSSVTGAVISRHSIAPGTTAEISMASLPGGTYAVQVQTESGSASFMVVR